MEGADHPQILGGTYVGDRLLNLDDPWEGGLRPTPCVVGDHLQNLADPWVVVGLAVLTSPHISEQ